MALRAFSKTTTENTTEKTTEKTIRLMRENPQITNKELADAKLLQRYEDFWRIQLLCLILQHN